jgi:winged helix DNA-binding protein
MRRTLHLLPAAEHGMWIEACGIYDGPKSPQWLACFGISQNELEAITEAIPQALGDKLLTREELANEIVRLTGIAHVHDKLRLGWGSLLKPACYRGYLCFGPNIGQHTQFAYPGTLGEGADNSGASVARKYLAAYGPATGKDFSRWLYGGTGSRATRAMLADLGEEAVEVDIEGTPAWMLRRHVRSALQNEPVWSVRLLPAFDQYVFAAGLRSARVLPGDFHARVYRSQGWFSPVLVVDGRMDGVWRFDRNGKRVVVTIEPFVSLKAKVKRAAGEEAERIAAFMERELELKWM